MLADALRRASGLRFEPAPAADVHGGSINRCVRWETDAGPVFVKIVPLVQQAMLEAEAEGLRELAASRSVRVPAVLALASGGAQAALALEWLDLGGSGDRAEVLLGQQLAALHRTTAATFGWTRENTIGSTPQPNVPADDWSGFYAEQRLGFQLARAERSGLEPRVVERGRKVAERCGEFFTTYRPVPSLLHGDLWGGNWAIERSSGAPVVFDPAVYYGDREADLAMTHLFGGFGPAFYAAYEHTWPLDPGASTRRILYNLYHVLNHFNLFGGGYGRQAARMIDRLYADLAA